MKSATDLLALRREQLIRQSDVQRTAVIAQGHALVQMLTLVDLSAKFGYKLLFSRIKNKPAILAGLLVAIIVIKPRRIFALLQKTPGLLKNWRMIGQIMVAVMSNRSKSP